jgi:4-nitrophenyl phosphatase
MSQNGLASIRAFVLDMDGVIWRANQPIGDLPWIFSRLKTGGYQVVLATNNSTLTPALYVQKLKGFGVELERWQVINSSQTAAHYLKQRFPDGGPVYVLGEVGLVEALNEEGFIHQEREVKAVVAGMDRQLNFEKLKQATMLIRAGALFVGTNPDVTFPTPEGLIPGAGAILAALETATSVKPVVVGKPSPQMYRVALQRLKLPPELVLVVGDRIETDIVGAQQIGCRSALVLSGVTSREDAEKWRPAPDLIAADLTGVVNSLST